MARPTRTQHLITHEFSNVKTFEEIDKIAENVGLTNVLNYVYFKTFCIY